jgi:hypothetical protein
LAKPDYVQGQAAVPDRYGVAAAGKFVKFPVAKHAQWYSGQAF